MLLIETLIYKKGKFYLLRVVRLKLFNIRTNFFFFVFTDLHLVLPFWQNSTLEPRSYGHVSLAHWWPYERGSNVLFCQNGKTKWRSAKTKKKNWSLCWKALNGPPSKDKIFSSQQGKKEKVIIYYPHSGGEDLPTEAAKPQRGIENFSF